MIRTKVANAVNTAKQWWARLYGVARDFRSDSSVVVAPADSRRYKWLRLERARRPSSLLLLLLRFERLVYRLAVFGG